MEHNSINVPETLRLCRGCSEPHYWDKRTNKPVAESKVPQPSFVLEELCLVFKVPHLYGKAKK